MTSPGQNPNFQTKKSQYLFLRPMYQIVDRQTQTQMHTHTQTHAWFDQGQPTIQLILLVIELIQEVKITLNILIRMGNRFSYLLTFEKWYRFLISIQTLYLILSLSYFNVRENILMQLTQPANNSKNVSDHCCDQFFLCDQLHKFKWLIFRIEINKKKNNFWKVSYHSWFGTNDNKPSVIERKQSHKLWIIDTAYIRCFTCVLNFVISWIQCPHNEINNNNCVNIKKSRSQCVSLTEKVLHRNDIIKPNDSQVGFV